MLRSRKLLSQLQLSPVVYQHAELKLRALGSAISPLGASVGNQVGTHHPTHALLALSDDKEAPLSNQPLDVVSLLACQPKGRCPSFLTTHHQLVFTQLLRASDPWAIHTTRSITFMRFISNGKSAINKRLGLPDAEDADAAIQDYQELRRRLDRVERPSTIKTWGQSAVDVLVTLKNGTVTVFKFLGSVPGRYQAWRAMTPQEWADWKKSTWATVKHEAHHYWVGTKLLAYEVRIASRHAWKAASGKQLSRRERAQLTRTTADLFRLVPMVIIIVIPFLEFALPILLRIFPNMLPSTFEDKLKVEEEMKRRLALRLELARFLQDTVGVMATDIAKRKGTSDTDAAALHAFIAKVRAGEPVENAEIIRFARLFNDELTLDNLDRLQLVGMCQFVGISTLGTDTFLRSRLRAHLSQIKADDYEIENEGLENLTDDELRAACRARGMRAPFGEGAVRFMQRQMRDWLDLSLHRGLPSSLLLLSRAFTITAKVSVGDEPSAKSEAAYSSIKETLGTVIPEEVVETVAAEVGGHPVDSVKALQQKLDFLRREEEAIRAELERAEAAAAAAAAAEAAVKMAHTAVAAADQETAAAEAAVRAATTAQPAMGATAEGAPSATAATAAVAAKPKSKEEVRVSAEEAAQAAAEAREERLRSTVSALMDLATGSGVTKERKLFMDLMRNEINRVNAVLTASGNAGSTGRMEFSAGGLKVSKEGSARSATAAGGAAGAAADQHDRPETTTVSNRLSERVTRMLTSIEQELDRVESKIGRSMHVLDTDSDGVISPDELANALGFLREQMAPEELQELLAKLTAASAAAVGVDVGSPGGSPRTSSGGAPSSSAGGAPSSSPVNAAAVTEAVRAAAAGQAAGVSPAAAAAVAAVASGSASNINVAELITLAAKSSSSSGGGASASPGSSQGGSSPTDSKTK